MTEYQIALAIWDKDEDIEKRFFYTPDVKRKYGTPDETYIVYYWDWKPMPFDEDCLKDKRHALIYFSEDNYFDYDIVDEDSRGCDEEFSSLFDWKLAITTPWRNGECINEEFI